jgi:hypothetical protein
MKEPDTLPKASIYASTKLGGDLDDNYYDSCNYHFF